jgi:hypothetical protein
MKRLLTCLLGAALVVAFASAASADTYYSLEAIGSSASIDGTPGGVALFNQGSTGSGTGVFPSFVQVQSTGGVGVGSAYNTTVNNVNDNGSSDQHNHEIQLQDVTTIVIGGVTYYQFFLDINENNNAEDKYISLDDLVVLVSGTPNQSSEPLPNAAGTSTVWALPTDSHILLDYSLQSGSGFADMTFLVRQSDFTAVGATGTSYVYLYSQFGEVGADFAARTAGQNANGVASAAGDYDGSDGFEEWAYNLEGGPPVVPDGGTTISLLGLGMLGLGYLRRRVR